MFVIIGLVAACRPVDLVGDSNIYAQPIEVEMAQVDTNTGDTAEPEAAESLAVYVGDGDLHVFHDYFEAPCNYDFSSNLDAQFVDQYTIEVRYGFEQQDIENICTENIAYVLQTNGLDLPAGNYTINVLAQSHSFEL